MLKLGSIVVKVGVELAVLVIIQQSFCPAVLELMGTLTFNHALQLLQIISEGLEQLIVGLRVEELAPVHPVVVLRQDLLY